MTCIQRRFFTWYWRQILTLLQRQKLTSHSRQFITCKKLSFPTLLQPYADVMLWRQYNLGATSCARWDTSCLVFITFKNMTCFRGRCGTFFTVIIYMYDSFRKVQVKGRFSVFLFFFNSVQCLVRHLPCVQDYFNTYFFADVHSS